MADAVIDLVMSDVSDTTDFCRLYAEYCRRIRSLVIRLGVAPGDAEDALQETFVVAWRRRSSLRDPNAIVPWLNAIAVRVAASTRRRAWARKLVGLESVEEPAELTTPLSVLESHRARQLVYGALDGIPNKKRTVFILFELQGMTGQEIAETVGCPLKTVWTRLFHARREFLARVAAIDSATSRHEKAG